MQIDLTPEQQDFVRRAIESGRFERAEDAVQAAMTLWVERERRRTEILTAIDIANASIDRGEGMDITQESMRLLAEDVKRRGRAQLAAAERPLRSNGASPCASGARRTQQHLELRCQRGRCRGG